MPKETVEIGLSNEGVLCENATPLSFSSTFLKLCGCFVDGHDRQIIFLSLFSTCELSHFSAFQMQ